MHDAHESSASAAPQTSFKVIAELDPPKGTNLQPFLDAALQLKGRVDAIRVTDSEHAIMRMAPYAPCLSLMQNHINPIMAINGRDRNRISFQADLLAASALGIHEIIMKKGHDPAEGDQPVTRSSGDLDLPTMIKSVGSLNRGNDLGGEPLQGATTFTAGVEIELSDNNSANRQLAESFPYMADNGIDSVVLGPTYDLNIIDIFLPAAEKAGLKLYTSIMFLKSVTMVKYLNNLPGVPSVPQEFLKKMMSAPVKRDAGMEIASDLYRDLSTLGNGTILLTIGLRERLPDFLSMIGR